MHVHITLRLAAPLLLVGLLACGESTSPASESPERRDIVNTGTKRYSQFDEELVIRDFFQDRTEGVFLDVGSSTPMKNSTTYYLEAHLGWSGIAIDALPEFAPQYERLRSRTRFFSYIVTDHSGTVESFYRVKGATGLSTTIPGREWEGRELQTEELKIPTITLDELLDQNGVERIDFLSLDIEGGAPKALAGFDIERFAPELVCVEKYGIDESGKLDPDLHPQKLLDYFREHGYERVERYDANDEVNWYFAPRDLAS
jgi:FkbM family methyltransferase